MALQVGYGNFTAVGLSRFDTDATSGRKNVFYNAPMDHHLGVIQSFIKTGTGRNKNAPNIRNVTLKRRVLSVQKTQAVINSLFDYSYRSILKVVNRFYHCR